MQVGGKRRGDGRKGKGERGVREGDGRERATNLQVFHGQSASSYPSVQPRLFGQAAE